MVNINKYIYIIFFPFCITAQTQTQTKSLVLVNYEVIYNTERPNTKTAYLEINLKTNNSVFLISKSDSELFGISKKGNEISIIG
jgi:hypothetical protein